MSGWAVINIIGLLILGIGTLVCIIAKESFGPELGEYGAVLIVVSILFLTLGNIIWANSGSL